MRRPKDLGRVVLLGLAIAVALLLVWLAWSVTGLVAHSNALDHRLDHAHAVRAQLQDVQQRQATALNKANRRLLNTGHEPVPVPPAPGPPGAQGPMGPQGVQGPPPSAADVYAAVTRYCDDGRCRAQVDASDVAAAVATYCDARGECRGPQGESITGPAGPAGLKGDTGARGPAGPGPSDAQVADAVAAYCSDGRCRGPQGPAGKDGQDGKQGETGPTGPQGPAGPTCPDGYSGGEFTVLTAGGPRTVYGCAADSDG